MINNIPIWIIAYLLGSIPFGVLLARVQSVDLREHGSGNIGATNVARVLGKKAGILTLLGDVLKGWLAVALASWVLDDPVVIAAAGLMAFCGHLFSMFLKFKGGKGVATGLGIHLYTMPMASLGAMGVFVCTLWISKYVSLSSIIAAIALPAFGIFLGVPLPYVYMSLLISVLVIFKHHENIRRILAGTESHFLKK
ncbi:MAG: glycerol-3-phosphate 1-O-acyltransferase PlsY [Nitrospinaceae bacterium]|jgi:glycerol-3-phosphate acyltransferase PlsY|nr:glycerol-3-phosphate 1-O-acyltransferase PlsY [Nitrospinaceae bacterium]